jgi:hypothetical protein
MAVVRARLNVRPRMGSRAFFVMTFSFIERCGEHVCRAKIVFLSERGLLLPFVFFLFLPLAAQ